MRIMYLFAGSVITTIIISYANLKVLRVLHPEHTEKKVNRENETRFTFLVNPFCQGKALQDK